MSSGPVRALDSADRGSEGDAGGGDRDADPGGRCDRALTPTPAAAEGAPEVAVLTQSATKISLHVSHTTAPFMLVLGQSIDKGWSATVSGGPSLGAPTLIDGFANGWHVGASTLAEAGHGGTFDVTLRFAPQTTINVALIVSGATVVICVAIVIVAWLRRRRTAPVGPAGSAADPGDQPSIDRLGRPSGFAMSNPVYLVLGTVVAGTAAWALGGLFAGVVTAVGVLLSMLLWWGRWVLRAAAVALMAGGVLDVVFHQYRYRYPPGGWPTQFNRASTLIWGAILLAGADAALEMVRRLRATRAERAPVAPPESDLS